MRLLRLIFEWFFISGVVRVKTVGHNTCNLQGYRLSYKTEYIRTQTTD